MASIVIDEPMMVGGLEAPAITPIGSLDDSQGTNGIVLEDAAPKPVLAILYNGTL